jgi:hypothetical protein
MGSAAHGSPRKSSAWRFKEGRNLGSIDSAKKPMGRDLQVAMEVKITSRGTSVKLAMVL